jgi:hypothetical protein
MCTVTGLSARGAMWITDSMIKPIDSEFRATVTRAGLSQAGSAYLTAGLGRTDPSQRNQQPWFSF